MFRADIRQLANGAVLKMEGRLAGDWAEEARSLLTKNSVPEGLVVDLDEVSYVDSVGEQVLNWLRSIGATFAARTIYATSICERLGLPLQGKPASPQERIRGSYPTSSPGKSLVS